MIHKQHNTVVLLKKSAEPHKIAHMKYNYKLRIVITFYTNLHPLYPSYRSSVDVKRPPNKRGVAERNFSDYQLNEI